MVYSYDDCMRSFCRWIVTKVKGGLWKTFNVFIECILGYFSVDGSVAEWSKALVLGTSHFDGVGSNPTAAIFFFSFLLRLFMNQLLLYFCIYNFCIYFYSLQTCELLYRRLKR